MDKNISIHFNKKRLEYCIKLRNRKRSKDEERITYSKIAEWTERDLDTVNYWKRENRILPDLLDIIAENLHVSFTYLVGVNQQNPEIVKQALKDNPDLPRDPDNPEVYILPYDETEMDNYLDHPIDFATRSKRKKAFLSWVKTIPWYPTRSEYNGIYSENDEYMKRFPVKQISLYYDNIEQEILTWLTYKYIFHDEIQLTIKTNERIIFNNLLLKWSSLSEDDKKLIDSMVNALANKEVHNG